MFIIFRFAFPTTISPCSFLRIYYFFHNNCSFLSISPFTFEAKENRRATVKLEGKIGFPLVSIKQECFSSNLNDVSVFSTKTKGYVIFVIPWACHSRSLFVFFSSFLFCSFPSLIHVFFLHSSSSLSCFLYSCLCFYLILPFFVSNTLSSSAIYGKIRIIHTHIQTNIIYYPRIMFK